MRYLCYFGGIKVRKEYLSEDGKRYILTSRVALPRVKWAAALIALCMGLLWEVLDSLLAGVWIFDPRGGDFADVLADAIGILFGLFL